MIIVQKGNDPAYPQPFASDAVGNMYHVGEKDRAASGLTKREIFAMAAMQGILSARADAGINCEWISEVSVKMADELLKQLES